MQPVERLGGHMGNDRESGFHERARSGPIHEYVVALREAWAPAKRLGATQTELARRGPFTEGTVSKYFSGGLTDKFVDTLLTFVTTPPYGTVIASKEERERLHTLRRRAQNVGTPGVKLDAAEEKIRQLERQLEAAEAEYRAGSDERVKELEVQLARYVDEILELRRQLRKVQSDLQAERDRNRRAALESVVHITALAERGLDGVVRGGRPQKEIADEQKMAGELLRTLAHLQQRAQDLQRGRTTSETTTWQEQPLPRLREREGALFRHAWPVRIYTTAATSSACAILLVNVASFVATCRDETGLNIAQLVAYVVLVFPVTLLLWGLLSGSALFVAYGHPRGLRSDRLLHHDAHGRSRTTVRHRRTLRSPSIEVGRARLGGLHRHPLTSMSWVVPASHPARARVVTPRRLVRHRSSGSAGEGQHTVRPSSRSVHDAEVERLG
ncbi:hypothetical protein ACFW5G_21525 [Streptomyces griseoaurantiacus]|uniref:hypothetical protein n=1 Tax=Streptomyces griseoaurantiacus TaxID=68213 RepID=UPI0036D1899F